MKIVAMVYEQVMSGSHEPSVLESEIAAGVWRAIATVFDVGFESESLAARYAWTGRQLLVVVFDHARAVR